MIRSAGGGAKVRRPNCLSPATQIRLAADVYRYSNSVSDDDSGCVLDEYSWIPSGLKPDDVHSYFASLPNEKVPFLNSVGEKWRISQLQYQLPTQDSDPSSLQNETERQEFQNFESSRKRECLGRGQIMHLPYDNSKRYCYQCKQPLNVDELVVGAQRFGEYAFWHCGCFQCTECKELLVELIYYKHENNVFCGRHHAEQLKPRCSYCDEIIFSAECTEAEGRVFHMNHFACKLCLCPLGGNKYVMRNNQSFCVPCYNKSVALSCNSCKREIAIDQPHITQADFHWHTDESCFCCSKCGKNLMGKSYTLIESALYCGQRSHCGQSECDYRASKRSTRRNESLCQTTPLATNIQTPLNNNGRVRFEFPHPPIQSPPLPPVQLNQTPPENIYETLSELPLPPKRRSRRRPNKFKHHSDDEFDSGSITSCTSAGECCSVDTNLNHHQMIKMRMKQRKAEMRSKRNQQRRSLSMDGCSSRLCSLHGANNPNDEVSFDQLSLKQNSRPKQLPVFVQQNDYTRMPPDFSARRPCSYDSSSTSESDDSGDDIYLNFSATMTPPQYIARQQQIKLYSSTKSNRTPVRPHNSKRRHNSMMPTPRTAKKKSHPNCFIS